MSSESGGARHPRLKPGPGHAAEDVEASQRARLRAAMIELVDEHGYDSVTVSQLTQRARVSTRTFYQLCKGKQECLLDTYDFIMQQVARQMAAARGDEADWRRRLQVTLEGFAAGVAADPRAARFAFIEATAVGLAVIERMRDVQALFESILSDCFDRAPDGVVVPPVIVKGIVAGLARVARMRVLAGREGELPDMVGELLPWVLCFRDGAAQELAELRGPLGTEPPRERLDLASEEAEGGRDGDPLAHERRLLLFATAGLAGKEGYSQLSAPRVRSAAGVSRQSFDANFEDIEAAFLASLELLTERVIAAAEAIGNARARSWPVGIHDAFSALCAHAAGDPALTRVAFIEVFAPGPEGIRQRERLTDLVAERLRASAPAGQRPSELATEASLGALWGIVHHQVLIGEERQLPQLAPALSYLVLAPAVGAESAVAAIRGD